MVNKPKNIGTAAETAVLKQVRLHWTDARREILHGSADRGDITGCGTAVIFEVKGGNSARTASAMAVEEWLRETEKERRESQTRFGVLVMARAGYGAPNADRWWAVMTAAAFGDLLGAGGHSNPSPIRLELGHLLNIFADQGFTDATA